jgi:hypothetical protein
MTQLSRASEKRDPLYLFRWGQLALSIILMLVGAFCLLKYMGWAWLVSGLYGLPSQAEKVAAAQRWGLMYFWAGLLVEGSLIASLAASLRLGNTELTGAPKVVARVFGAIAIAVVGTLGTAFLLTWVGKLLH